jgi:predicted RNase H-like HicB family nuclease
VTTGYAVTLEHGSDGTYLAWVDELPGCAVRGASKEQVLSRLPEAIGDFVAWTGAASSTEPLITVTEEIESAIEAEEDTEVLVAVDRQPLTEEDWSRIEDWLGRSRAELSDLLSSLTDEELEATRAGRDRTVREEIEHVAFVELMYAMWTFDLRSRGGLSDFLAWTREVAVERLRALAREGSGDLTWADWGGAPRLEPWTPRKAARRLVWHERLHQEAIRRFAGRNPR